MTRYTRSMTDVSAASRKPAIARGLGLLAFVGCAGLLLVGTSDHPRMARMRAAMTEITAPVMQLVSQPAQAIGGIGRWWDEIAHLRGENARLRAENDALKRWKTVAMALESENRELRQHMGYRPVENTRYVTARIIGYSATGAAHSVMIDSGLDDGVRAHQAVISADGLIGRVSDVSAHAARVMLLGDVNARMPVVGETSRERAVLAGNGTAMPQLKFLRAGSAIKVGEKLVTAADGGVVPAGIAVGQVFSQSGGVVRVELLADARRIGVVRVVNHETPLSP